LHTYILVTDTQVSFNVTYTKNSLKYIKWQFMKTITNLFHKIVTLRPERPDRIAAINFHRVYLGPFN